MGGWSTPPSTGGSGFTGTYGSGTITADTPITFTQTWNNAGVTFSGLKFNVVTDTASNAASLLADFQVAGTSLASIAKDGVINSNKAGIGFNGAYKFAGGSAGSLGVSLGALVASANSISTQVFSSNSKAAFGLAGSYTTTPDVYIVGEAANVLSLRGSTNAQTLRIYGTDDGTQTNYSRIKITHAGGTAGATIATEAGGTGTAGPLTLTASSVKVGTNTVVASLPSASTAGAGARAFVTDATAPTFGATVAGSGAVSTPVYSDGTNWKVG